MKKVFIVGSINMDLVIASDRLPLMGETIHGRDFFTNPGGKGANQAVAVQKSGGDARFCACVGNDDFGDILIGGLKACGVDTRFVTRENAPSGVAVITVVDGDNCIVLGAGANAHMDISKAERCLCEADAGDILLVQLEIDSDAVLFALRRAKEKGMTTILNPAPAKGFRAEFLPYVDYLVPNETETAELSGRENFEEAVDALCGKVKTLIVTLGGQGCLYCKGGERIRIPCPKVRAVDTTAAGDTFCGALAARLSAGEDERAAVSYALAAASLAVTKQGAQQSIPFERKVREFLEKRL